MSDEEYAPSLVDQDGRTSCCGAYTSIFMDDGVEYCKACYEPIQGVYDTPRYTVDLDNPSAGAVEQPIDEARARRNWALDQRHQSWGDQS